ncbi:hypothetical protein BD779DRAFT_1476095 [Infundibulicybe gibba]|nr:hypothetical protein BD779DRAFT_1476095 [Infundibulicybe gibba]
MTYGSGEITAERHDRERAHEGPGLEASLEVEADGSRRNAGRCSFIVQARQSGPPNVHCRMRSGFTESLQPETSPVGSQAAARSARYSPRHVERFTEPIGSPADPGAWCPWYITDGSSTPPLWARSPYWMAPPPGRCTTHHCGWLWGAQYHIVNEALISVCFLPASLGNLIGPPLAGRILDKTVVKWRQRRGRDGTLRIDSELLS